MKSAESGLIERIVENWLTNSTERVYEIPFCQLLTAKGYKLVHKTTHGPTENGKDIITRDPKGRPCAFQLKTGFVNNHEWQKISGEVNQLLEIRIDHPNIKPSEMHRAVLVTNGTISEDVRTKITALNRGNRYRRGIPPLETCVGTEILADFMSHFGSFLPRAPEDFNSFLRMFLGDGQANLPEEPLAQLLDGYLLRDSALSVRARRESFSSALVMTTYALQPHQRAGNHLSVAKGYALYIAYALAAAEKFSIPVRDWRDSVELAWDAIDRESSLLKDEVLARDGVFLEGNMFGDGALIMRVRAVLTLGWLAGMELARKSRDSNYDLDPKLPALIQKSKTFFFGEYSTIYFLAMALFVEKTGLAGPALSRMIEITQALAEANASLAPGGFRYADPHVIPEVLIQNLYGLTDPRDGSQRIQFDSFDGTSHTIKALVHALARRDERRCIADNWPNLSRMQTVEFVPKHRWQHFQWLSEQGAEDHVPFPLTGSWSDVKKDAHAAPKGLPRVLAQTPWFIPIFLLTFPHRTTPAFVRAMDGD